MPCYKIHIAGSVFKTGFRYYLKEKAVLSGIKGRVYYENGESVGITASGTEEEVKKFLDFCSIGNPFFRINRLEVVEAPPEEFSSFEVEDIVTDGKK
ncbi:MAG: acylphosphatase [Bacteroidales bacterium]|nr:acylphosphatase [Bacteroidales bacterium]